MDLDHHRHWLWSWRMQHIFANRRTETTGQDSRTFQIRYIFIAARAALALPTDLLPWDLWLVAIFTCSAGLFPRTRSETVVFSQHISFTTVNGGLPYGEIGCSMLAIFSRSYSSSWRKPAYASCLEASKRSACPRRIGMETMYNICYDGTLQGEEVRYRLDLDGCLASQR